MKSGDEEETPISSFETSPNNIDRNSLGVTSVNAFNPRYQMRQSQIGNHPIN